MYCSSVISAQAVADRPFDRLTVLSDVEGLTILGKVEGESRSLYTGLPPARE